MPEEEQTQCWNVVYVKESYFDPESLLVGTYRTEKEANEAVEREKVEWPDLGVVDEYNRSYIEVRRDRLTDGTCWIPQAVWLVWCCTTKGYVEAEELLGVYTSEALAHEQAEKHGEFVARNPAHAVRECNVVIASRPLDQ